ncbi:MAG: hypothetical protein QOJ22_284, partial [Thermoleophilaceae bacterium]|nr:hypothetical protein [Thermoleophilaceae bacterium]
MRPAATALALLVLAGATACGSGGGEEPDAEGIAFGVIAPLSGPYAARGRD